MSAVSNIIPFLTAAQAGTRRVARTGDPKQVRTRTPKVNLVEPGWAFYRKYTEAMLRRFMRCSLQSGRVPSMLGKEMFRGKVTSYRMESFDDMLIFTHDVDKCLRRLPAMQQLLLTRIAIQEYTLEEVGAMLKVNRMTATRRYEESLDLLTGIFIEVRLLEHRKSCQEEEIRKDPASVSLQAAYLVA